MAVRKYLLLNTKRVDVTIGDLPSKVPIRVFTVDESKKECDKKSEEREKITLAWSHFAYTDLRWKTGTERGGKVLLLLIMECEPLHYRSPCVCFCLLIRKQIYNTGQ